jgi:hypothetical protein
MLLTMMRAPDSESSPEQPTLVYLFYQATSNQSLKTQLPYYTMTDKTEKKQESGITGAGKVVTSTLGNTVGGLANTVGGVVGAASRGLGETVTSATGGLGKPVGEGVANIGTGVESGVANVAQGVKDAGEWKTAPKKE